jgi:hypothetical protein
MKKKLIETLKARWSLKRNERHPHRLEEAANTQKF